MNPAPSDFICKKTFTSSSHYPSEITLSEDHLRYRYKEQIVTRKIYYSEIISAKLIRVNLLFYISIFLFSALLGFVFLILIQTAPPLYPLLSFLFFLLFFCCVLYHGKCLYAVQVTRFGVQTRLFFTSRRSEAIAVAKAINETLTQLRE